MAHSYVSYRGTDRHLNDAAVALVVYSTLAHAAGAPPERFDRLRGLLARWATVIDDCAPGCIDLELDAHLATEADRQQFADLLRGAERHVLARATGTGSVNFRQAVPRGTEQSIQFADELAVEQVRSAFAAVLSVVADTPTA